MNELSNVPATNRAALPLLDHSIGESLGWLRSEIDRLFDDFGRPAPSFFNFDARFPVPAIDMVEEEKDYKLTVELPGLSEKDIEISLADGALCLSGEKKEEAKRKEEGYMMCERRYGSFERTVTLPSDVDPEAINATFKDGVLTVTLKKDENCASRTRKIAIGKA